MDKDESHMSQQTHVDLLDQFYFSDTDQPALKTNRNFKTERRTEHCRAPLHP